MCYNDRNEGDLLELSSRLHASHPPQWCMLHRATPRPATGYFRSRSTSGSTCKRSCTVSWATRLFRRCVTVILLVYSISGVVLALYFMTIHVFVTPKRGHRPYDKLYAIFSSVMILLTTVWICTQGHFGEVLWVLGRTRPCDPGSEDESGWYFGCGPVAAMLLQLMTDALTVRLDSTKRFETDVSWTQIYRCWMAWGTPFVVAVPLVLWVITLSEWCSYSTPDLCTINRIQCQPSES